MKKNFLTKVMTLAIAATMILTPVTASAAEKTVVTRDQFDQYYDDSYLEAFGYDVAASKQDETLRDQWLSDIDADYTGDDDPRGAKASKILYSKVASLNGCYQTNGYKIYTALDNKTVTVKKTGNYSVIVGGKTVKKDQGTLKFVAPKTGTYKFTFSTKNNVAGSQIYITQDCNTKMGCFFKVNQRGNASGNIKKSATILITDDPKHSAAMPFTTSALAHISGNISSKDTKVSGSLKMKKGQWISFTGRDCSADYDGSIAYNFNGFDLTITKTK